MDLKYIKILDAINRAGSISAAAKELYIAKSAISRALSTLEADYGYNFIDETSYKAKLSSKAQAVLEQAQDLILQEAKLEHYARNLSNVEASICFLLSPLLDLRHLRRVCQNIQEKYPKTNLVFRNAIMDVEKIVLDRKVDLALTEQYFYQPNLIYKELGTVELPLTIATINPLYKEVKDLIHEAKFKQALEILKKQSQIILSYHKENFSRAGGIYDNDHYWHVNNLEHKKQLIVDGVGWGRLPLYSIKNELQSGQIYHLLELEEMLVKKTYIVKHTHANHGEVAAYIWENLPKMLHL